MAGSKLRIILENNSSPLKTQLEILCDVIELLGEKLQANYEEYKKAPLSVSIVKQDGEVVYRANPFVEEYRSTLRDYHNALSKLEDLAKTKIGEQQFSSLNDLRAKFKIVK